MRTLLAVAGATNRPQVSFDRQSARCFWLNVVNFQFRAEHVGVGVAIATPMLRRIENTNAQGDGDVCDTHTPDDTLPGSSPRSRSNARAFER